MKLIGSPTSPYVRKVRVVFAEKKLDYQLEIENVWEPTTKIQNHNPIGKVPCLLIEENESLYDSRVIVEYLDTLSPVGRLIPQAGRERANVKCWEALGDGLLDAAVTIVKEKQRPAEQISQAWIDRQLSKIHAALATMSKGLGDQSFCTGINYSLADIATGCALGYLDFRFPEIDWRTPYPNLAKFYDKVAARQSFIDTLPPAP
jgi:glutathione S-transferase